MLSNYVMSVLFDVQERRGGVSVVRRRHAEATSAGRRGVRVWQPSRLRAQRAGTCVLCERACVARRRRVPSSAATQPLPLALLRAAVPHRGACGPRQVHLHNVATKLIEVWQEFFYSVPIN